MYSTHPLKSHAKVYSICLFFSFSKCVFFILCLSSHINRQSLVKHQPINWNFVNESKPIHLGPLKTKAYMTSGTRTVYKCICFFHFDAQLDGASIKSQCVQFNFNEGRDRVPLFIWVGMVPYLWERGGEKGKIAQHS